MWDSGRGVGQKYRETLYVSQDIGLATHFTGSGTQQIQASDSAEDLRLGPSQEYPQKFFCLRLLLGS